MILNKRNYSYWIELIETICGQKMSLGSLKNIINKMFTNHVYLVYMYKAGFGIE